MIEGLVSQLEGRRIRKVALAPRISTAGTEIVTVDYLILDNGDVVLFDTVETEGGDYHTELRLRHRRRYKEAIR